MSRTLISFCIVVVAMLIAAPIGSADTINISASKDNTLYEDATGSLSNGTGNFLFSGRTGALAGNRIRRAVLSFDLTGIPAGSTITNATLTLTVNRAAPGATATNYSLHSLTQDWGEGSTSAPGGGGANNSEGQGGASTPNSATWIHTFFPGSTWTSAGGDFVGAPSATTSINGLGSFNWSSAGLISDTQGWVDNSSTNFGWILIGNETGTTNARRFHSRENITNTPLLTIDFTPIPEPTTFGILGLASLGIVLLRRRRR